MRKLLQFVLPILVLAAGGGGYLLLVSLRPEAIPAVQHVPVPVVRAVEAVERTIQIIVRTQGNVDARTEIDLVPEVSGKVIEMSPSLTSGGFFEEGEVLLAIDPRSFELAITREKASVARAEQLLKIEEAEAEVARKEWLELGRGEKPSPLVLREPQLAEARAVLAAAQAVLQEAELDRDRTKIAAPFAGRVRRSAVDVGQFVTRGERLARLYAVDYAEVRLPVPDEELAYIDLLLDYRGGGVVQDGPLVNLHADFAGRRHTWTGRIVRTDGEIDSRTRQVVLIAQVENPYGRSQDQRPPLAVGMFVQAEILGRHYEDVIALPPSAIRNRNKVLVIDEDERLHLREVEVLRSNRDSVLITSGLDAGELVCLSILETVTEGMKVQIDGEDEEEAPAPGKGR